MSIQERTPSATIYVPVPHLPGLALVCSDPERYSPAFVQDLARRLGQAALRNDAAPTSPSIDAAAVKAALRCILAPQRLDDHPLALAFGQDGPARRGEHLARWLRAAVGQLEYADAAEPDLRGAILRLRFLERRRAKTVMRLLNLSERHFYRLQAAGLAWLAGQLAHEIHSRQAA